MPQTPYLARLFRHYLGFSFRCGGRKSQYHITQARVHNCTSAGKYANLEIFMTLSHFYKASLTPAQRARAVSEAEHLFTDVSPSELDAFLATPASDLHAEGLDLVMSVRMGELRRERGFFIHD
jgi:hypothetical protein